MTTELNHFLLLNRDGFFDNKVINSCPSKDISSGSKLSKSLKKFINEDTNIRWAQDEISKIIQENKVEGYLYLSVDPRDFLTLSESGHNWGTCHSLDGEYRTGNLSCMVDSTTIIAYLANDDKEHFRSLPTDIKWYNKKWRMLVHTNMYKCIYYSRQYPFTSKNLLNETHTMLTTKMLPTKFTDIRDDGFKKIKLNNTSKYTITDANQIYVGGKIFDTRNFIDVSNYTGYCDLINSSSYTPLVSLNDRKYYAMVENFSSQKNAFYLFYDLYGIKIGEDALCPCCGNKILDRGASFLCPSCRKKYVAYGDFYLSCSSCGRRIYEGDKTFWIDQAPYCKCCYREEQQLSTYNEKTV